MELVRGWAQAFSDLVLAALKERGTTAARRYAYYMSMDPWIATRAMARAMVAVVLVAVGVTMASLSQTPTYETSAHVLVAGMTFFVPFLGAAVGAMSGSLANVGIDDDFIKQVREKVTEGTSALFALTSGATALDKVVDELKQYNFEIISTNLPEEQENQLREAFAQE
jgi:uncharacterized membrane protein